MSYFDYLLALNTDPDAECPDCGECGGECFSDTCAGWLCRRLVDEHCSEGAPEYCSNACARDAQEG